MSIGLGGQPGPQHVVGAAHDLHAEPAQVGVQHPGAQVDRLTGSQLVVAHQQRGQHGGVARVGGRERRHQRIAGGLHHVGDEPGPLLGGQFEQHPQRAQHVVGGQSVDDRLRAGSPRAATSSAASGPGRNPASAENGVSATIISGLGHGSE